MSKFRIELDGPSCVELSIHPADFREYLLEELAPFDVEVAIVDINDNQGFRPYGVRMYAGPNHLIDTLQRETIAAFERYQARAD